MTAWIQLVPARPWVTEKPGLCLRYAQSFFGATPMHRSAWHAWLSQKHRHSVWEPVPQDAPVILWYSHFGAYDDGLGPYDGRADMWGNWGHVTPIIPGQGIYSSPANPYAGYSYDVYQTIAEVEAAFNCRYVGWSEDINGLRVAAPAPEKEKDPMPEYKSHTFRPQQPRKIGTSWTYLTLNEKGDVTVLSGGQKGRRIIGSCNLDVKGTVDVRAVIERTNPAGTKVLESRPRRYERVTRFGSYWHTSDIPAGWRLRYQARAIDKTPALVGQMGYDTDYWEIE